ncbi:hypothetical protein C8R42DRAFT_13417 [Lentinula raphanica]|nr:hypothetical protein C8R42DRAFT_13417 [Lentinula raphanica]
MDCVFAPELLDHIIDQLGDDKKSLLAVSLSCKQLLTRSRYRLFHTFRPGRYFALSQTLSALFEILDAPYSSMGRAIHCLVIGYDLQFPSTLPSDLLRIRKNLVNVTTLCWNNYGWWTVPDAFKTFVFGLNIETFIINDVYIQDSRELAEMITMLPSTLKNIVIGSIRYSHDTANTESINDILAKRKKIHLNTLHSGSTMAAKNLFQPLLSSNISTIDRLVIDGHRSDEEAVQMVDGMLSTFGPSLSGFTYLNLMAAGRRNLVVPILSLQDRTNLRTLHIQSIYLGSSYNIGPEFLPTAVQNII